MSDVQHGPLPWKVIAERVIVDAGDDYVCAMHDAAIAGLVVRTMNAHAPLLAACGRATRHLGPLDSGTVSGLRTPLDELKAALAAAGVEVG